MQAAKDRIGEDRKRFSTAMARIWSDSPDVSSCVPGSRSGEVISKTVIAVGKHLRHQRRSSARAAVFMEDKNANRR